MLNEKELIFRMALEFATLSLTDLKNHQLFEITQKVIDLGPAGCADFLASLTSTIAVIGDQLTSGDSKNQVLIDDICSKFRRNRIYER